MKALKNNMLILSAVVFFLTAPCVYAYPPDNAAVLYYKAAALFEVDDEMSDMLSDLRKGNIEINDEIREFDEKNRLIIDTILDASQIKNCDWGMDFFQGLEMQMPPLSSLKKLVYLVIADAKIMAKDGRYGPAIYRCMSLYKMARHINDRNLICYLVGIAVNGMTNNCLINIISDMPQHTRNMTRLKNDLIEIDSIPLSIKPAILGERQAALMFMTPEHLPDVVRDCVEDGALKEKLLSADEAFLESNRKYFENCYSTIIDAYDMPYIEGYNVMMDLAEKMKEDFKTNPDATLASLLMPATHRIFSIKTRSQTHNNAIKTAIELYLIKAKTGKLPEKLPANLPGDMFSGKAFDYEITSEGFILRCQGKNLSKDMFHEYEFKVAK